MRHTRHLEKYYVPGLSEFNYHVTLSIKSGILGAQLEALHQLRQEKNVLQDSASYFRERLPHWPVQLPDFLFCKYVLHRLSIGMDDVYKRRSSEEFFARTVVNTRFDKVAMVVKKRKERRPCSLHKNKMGDSNGRCPFCYSRLRACTTAGVRMDKLSNSTLTKILSLPSYAKTGRSCGFIKAVRALIEEAKWLKDLHE